MQLLDRPIAYQPSFVGLGVGVTGAVLLSQLVYWHNRMDAGWFYKTQKEIKEETGLSREEQETARKRLVSAGVLEEVRRGVPAKLYFRVKEDALEALLMKKIKGTSQSAGKPHSSMRESRILERGKAANKNADIPQASLRESRSPDCGNPADIHTVDYTEITTEITTEKKPVRQPASPTDQQANDSLKIDYKAVQEIFHSTLPELPVVLKMTDDRRKKLRKLWADYELNLERWGAYLRFISKKCRWMLEDRPDTNTGKTWRKKDFDYLITEKCYLKVKEERANDLPKVQKLDSVAREDAYTRLVSQRRKPQNEVEALAASMAGSLGRMTDYDARRAWAGIWAQAVSKASENDLARLAS
ncbi:hypothetical protein [Serratia rhizosphaerae]|uniref:hypothetical protein n=1 Tax=Serratia rhizosphaerae TaxID=2597702 RepID=UPI0019154DA3|nr:hypothetical protein [Serratia rhizosphaerae]